MYKMPASFLYEIPPSSARWKVLSDFFASTMVQALENKNCSEEASLNEVENSELPKSSGDEEVPETEPKSPNAATESNQIKRKIRLPVKKKKAAKGRKTGYFKKPKTSINGYLDSDCKCGICSRCSTDLMIRNEDSNENGVELQLEPCTQAISSAVTVGEQTNAYAEKSPSKPEFKEFNDKIDEGRECSESDEPKIINSEADSSQTDGSKTLKKIEQGKTKVQRFRCERCLQGFVYKTNLNRHIALMLCDPKSKITFPCEVCNKEFSRKDNLREHMRCHEDKGKVKSQPKIACKFCNHLFSKVSQLQIHIRSHTGEKPYSCDDCSKSFAKKPVLIKHMKTHAGERPFECPICKARLATKDSLVRHVRAHSPTKNHVCSICEKGFAQAVQLRAHMFQHTGEHGFKCEDCGKEYGHRKLLFHHIKSVHGGEGPYVCSKCPKKFTRMDNLRHHERLHEGEYPYQCHICHKMFSIKYSLKVHLEAHEKKSANACKECGQKFDRRDLLSRHMRSKHTATPELIIGRTQKKNLKEKLLSISNLALAAITSTEEEVESSLEGNVAELISALIDAEVLQSFNWHEKSVNEMLESLIYRCGRSPVPPEDHGPMDQLRENTKILFTIILDDSPLDPILEHNIVDQVLVDILRQPKA